MLWIRGAKDPKLIIRVINFELVQPMCPRYSNVMDCAVEVDGSVVSVIIGARVGECTARFWSGRSLSNYHMARRRGDLWVEPLPCGLHVYAGEPRLLHLRTA